METGLDNLVKNVPKDKLLNLLTHYQEKQLELLQRNGVFPYDWFDNYNKLKYTKLPTKEEFFSKLNEEPISEENHKHAIQVWNKFNMKLFLDYHDLFKIRRSLII